MAGNTFGSVFKVTTFGESHGAALGAVIDGCPAGLAIKREEIQASLNRRRPGRWNDAACGGGANPAVTSRKEADEVEILSGVYQGITEGTPIALLIRNTSQHSSDYDNLINTFRPGHADLTYFLKYACRDPRGGGRSSGRETAARVAAGAIAQKLLAGFGVKITAYTIEAAGIKALKRDMEEIERNMMRAPDNDAANAMINKIAQLRKEKDSAGGIAECIVQGAPAGLGEAVFDKLDAMLAHAMLSIGAVKGIEFGAGFDAAKMTASRCNDAMRAKDGKVCFASNNAGGILGGISRGDDIVFRVAIKPVPSISRGQETVSWNKDSGFENSGIVIEGRHDVCLCPRIIPVIEAMAAIVLADMLLRNKNSRL